MKFGLLIAKQYPPGESPRKRFLEHLEQVRLARDLGFHTIVLGQHFLSSPFQELQSVPFLARLAADSGEMRLGLTVLLLPLLPPVEVAEVGATLDVISDGRFICGLGLGYRAEEYDAFGITREERVRRFEMSVDIIKRLWTEERVNCDTPYCRLKDATLTLRPLQRPRPPIWLAANTDAAVRRAARLGDAWIINPHASLDSVRNQLDLYGTELASSGKAFPDDLPMLRELYVAPARDQAWSEVRPYLDTKYGAYRAWGQDKVLPAEDHWAPEFRELARDRFIIGDPEEVCDEIQRYAQELPQVNHLLFRVQYPAMPQELVLCTIRLLGERVLPKLG